MTLADVIERWCMYGGHMAEDGDALYRETDRQGALTKTVCACCIVTELGRADWAVMERRLKDYWGEDAA